MKHQHHKRPIVRPYNNDKKNLEKLVYHFGLMKRNFVEQYNSHIQPHPASDFMEINLNTGEFFRRGLCNTSNGNTRENYFWRWDWTLEFLSNDVLSELDKAMISQGKSTKEFIVNKYAEQIERYEFTLFYAKYVTPAFFNQDLIKKIPSHFITNNLQLDGISITHLFKATPLSIKQFEKAAVSRNIPFEQFTIDPIAPDARTPTFDTQLTINYIERN